METKLFELMQLFAPHAFTENFDNETTKQIETTLQGFTEKSEQKKEIERIFNGWQEHGSSSERYFVKYFRYILKNKS